MKNQIISYFRKADPVIWQLAVKFRHVSLKPADDYFLHLAQTIVSQQLSEQAGMVIWSRFEKLFTATGVTAAAVLSKNPLVLHTSGISLSKANYIQNVARTFINKTIQPRVFSTQSDEEIIRQLVSIKGIGRWSAEMFLIFALGRQDVFSAGDAGLRRALQHLYGQSHKLTDQRILEITRSWSPYRSFGCLLLWRSLDNSA
ncbi:hypothetical protein A2154_03470 [Candidatus Gottesmanbacteria bacterium RBG_16_43_7]|uniref:DNA-3-methyladenine glycosylase II n=1 Tax=Candidatus Gottesmanbacteria bacterium RBG_16_43_7 TaxID=1798373 RepID=A0A1F5ZA60_9BACT|nr:MAG: hypothetical protein A2154_03470 [Candidatus Gottesmanbacteria bacterium RBG_16_43_7]